MNTYKVSGHLSDLMCTFAISKTVSVYIRMFSE